MVLAVAVAAELLSEDQAPGFGALRDGLPEDLPLADQHLLFACDRNRGVAGDGKLLLEDAFAFAWMGMELEQDARTGTAVGLCERFIGVIAVKVERRPEAPGAPGRSERRRTA